jgi:peroxiredoxin
MPEIGILAGLCYVLGTLPEEASTMKRMISSIALFLLVSLPLLAALKVGEKAPDFSANASLAGKEFNFSLADALKKGPAVVYFYPSAYTNGCDIEAHTFAEMKDQFDAAGATIIGVSLDSIDRLKQFSADPSYCAGKFPVASDAGGKIAATYNLTTTAVRAGMKDVRGVDIDHDLIERATFVVGKDRTIIATLSSNADKLSPADHVKKSLEIVQGLKRK